MIRNRALRWNDENINQHRFNVMNYSAKRRNLTVSIKYEQYMELMNRNCYYCNGTLPKAGSGLDRIDNSKGYELDNVLPCCTACNRGRNNNFTVEEWKVAMNAVWVYRQGK